MFGPILRKYGAATTINFPLFSGAALVTAAVHAAGDVKIMKNEGTEANTASGFVDEGQGYSLALGATEMQAARIVIYIVDQPSGTVWDDQVIVLETYGNASAQHAFDMDLAEQTVALSTQGKADVNAECLDVLATDTIAELSQAQPPTTPTMRQALMLLYMAIRNQRKTTSTEDKIHNDAGTVIAKSTTSVDGVTFTVTKKVAGP